MIFKELHGYLLSFVFLVLLEAHGALHVVGSL